MQTELIKEVNKVLKAFPQFWNGEELQRSMVSEAISQKQPSLIKALVANEKLRSVYGADIDGVLIFDFDKLVRILKYKEYWDNSFTKYRNKVGLTSEGKYLHYSSDVVLDFSFKDCVLEGGMTKESQGKEEVYYNEVIARDEIDRLFSPKVLANSKRYTKEGVEEGITEFNEDNLIIKGNNLIALHSLKYRFQGKVKLVYIDPPYNTGGDSFKYNDSFNHSTWLTFMRNRLIIARDLLRDDGVIFIQCDDNEQAYLKVLLDEIFGRENFINTIIWKRKSGSVNPRNKLNNSTDFILCYAKSEHFKIIPTYTLHDAETQAYIKERFKYTNENGRKYRLSPIISPTYSAALVYEYKGYFPPPNGWSLSRETMERFEAEGRLHFPENINQRIQRKQFIDEYKGRPIGNLWADINVINPMSGERLDFVGQKPESLIQRVIELSTNENDIVLDYHLGSGTTCAAAHKMGRKYIGIEQMDYINEMTTSRLQKVIEGEQVGISKAVDWQGGGSFLYTELMELNYVFIDQIQQAQSTKDLLKLFEVMKAEAHLNYQVALENVLSAEYEMDGIPRKVAFSELELYEQKQLLIEILDKNQLYVNASEMDDCDLSISESDKAFTRSFYGME